MYQCAKRIERDETCGIRPKITTKLRDKTADYKLTVRTSVNVCACVRACARERECKRTFVIAIHLNTVPKLSGPIILIRQFRSESFIGYKDKVIAVHFEHWTKHRNSKKCKTNCDLKHLISRESTSDLAFHETQIRFSLAIKTECFCWQFKVRKREM